MLHQLEMFFNMSLHLEQNINCNNNFNVVKNKYTNEIQYNVEYVYVPNINRLIHNHFLA